MKGPQRCSPSFAPSSLEFPFPRPHTIYLLRLRYTQKSVVVDGIYISGVISIEFTSSSTFVVNHRIDGRSHRFLCEMTYCEHKATGKMSTLISLSSAAHRS